MQENKKKILDSSIKLFSEKGIFRTTLADIASDAAISKGTLFYYYRSKDDLLYDILDISTNEITEAVKEAIRVGAAVSNKEIMLIVFKSLLKYDFLMKINYYLLQEALLENNNFAVIFREKYSAWRKDIEDVLSRLNKTGPSQRKALSAIILACVDGICLQCLLDPDAINLDDISDQLARVLPFHES
ncbi:MAG: TetR/AcrR family transcriptional regulator [Bacillota bacterium]